MNNIVQDEKILCFNCGKAYLKSVVKDYIFVDELEERTLTIPDILTYVCPKCGEESFSPKSIRKIEDYMDKHL